MKTLYIRSFSLGNEQDAGMLMALVLANVFMVTISGFPFDVQYDGPTTLSLYSTDSEQTISFPESMFSARSAEQG